ncbi:MAG: hypothetical protein WCI73_01015, partial [Phycisphaerae bacterium]
ANWFDGLPTVEFRDNIWWRQGGGVDFQGYSWQDWQRRGFDREGSILDPLILVAEEGGRGLRADSPLLQAGIPWPDVAHIGPRPQVLASGELPADLNSLGAFVWVSIEAAAPPPANQQYDDWYKDRYESYPDRTPCRIAMKAVCENAGAASWSGEVRFYASDGLSTLREIRQTVQLAPGERMELLLAAEVPQNTREVVLRADSATAGFHGSLLSLGFRPVVPTVRIDAGSAAKNMSSLLPVGSELVVRHAAVELGRFRIGLAGNRLALWARVYDSHIELLEPVYKGSMIDLFGISTGTGDNAGQVAATYGQVFLVPPTRQTPARLAHANMGAVGDVEIDAKLHPDGYEISVLIPLEVLKIEIQDGEFAFKAAIYTHAPGISGILRAHLFNERFRADIHAYGIMKVLAS